MKKLNITFRELADEFNHNAEILYKLSQESIPDDMAKIVDMATSLTTECQAMIELCLVAESRVSSHHPGTIPASRKGHKKANQPK
jgi:hypothetical protein